MNSLSPTKHRVGERDVTSPGETAGADTANKQHGRRKEEDDGHSPNRESKTTQGHSLKLKLGTGSKAFDQLGDFDAHGSTALLGFPFFLVLESRHMVESLHGHGPNHGFLTTLVSRADQSRFSFSVPASSFEVEPFELKC